MCRLGTRDKAPAEGEKATPHTQWAAEFRCHVSRCINQRYDFVYLDDPQDALGALDDPSMIGTIIRKGLANAEPAAYAFIRCWRSPRSKSTGRKKLSTRRETRPKGPDGGRRTTPRWWGPGSRGHRASIARVLASLDSLIRRIPRSSTMFFALQRVGPGTDAHVAILTMVRPSTFDLLVDRLS